MNRDGNAATTRLRITDLMPQPKAPSVEIPVEEMQKQVDAARFLARQICATLEGLETQPPAGPARAQRAA